MGWETRSGRRYYYSKKRVGKQVISVYRGQAGSLAELLEACQNLERAEQSARERQNLEQFIHSLDKLDRIVNQYSTQVRRVVAEVLEQVGYRKHKGQWRMPRKMTKQITLKATLEEWKELQRLLDKAEEKSATPADVEKAEQYGHEHPALFDGVDVIYPNVINGVLASVKLNPSGKVYLRGEAANLRRSLGEATASPLEKLLIQDIAVCWMRLHLMEQVYSYNHSDGNLSNARADLLERRLSATHKRYLQAVESLARVRRLLTRAGVQINVAEQQVVMNGC